MDINHSHDMSADSSGQPSATFGNPVADSIGESTFSCDLETDMATLSLHSDTAPTAPSQPGSPMTTNGGDFKLFPYFPAEIRDRIFVEAAYAPRCHLFFIKTGFGSRYEIISYDNLKAEYGSGTDEVMMSFYPRLPVSGQNDRLSVSLTCKAAKKAIELAIRTRPDDWKKIGQPGQVPVLFNTASDLAWLVGCRQDWSGPPENADLSSLLLWWHPELPFHQYSLSLFAGIKRVAIDLWPKIWNRDVVGHDLYKAAVIAKYSGYFRPVCYLLNHFSDLKTVYFLDTERFDFDQQQAVTGTGDSVGVKEEELDQEAQCQIREDAEVQELPRWSRYHFRNLNVSRDTPIEDLGVSDECDGIERSFEVHSRADDTFVAKIDVDGHEGLYGRFTEFRAPSSFLKQVHEAVRSFREKLLHPPDYARPFGDPGCLTKEGLNEILEKQKRVDFKLLTWELVDKD